MESTSNLPGIRWRSVPLILAGLIAGAFVLSPAVGEAAQFLTKKKGDKRYLQNNAVVTVQGVVPNNDGATFDVLCPAGRQATGGGVDSSIVTTNSTYMLIDESKPILSGARSIGWNVEVVNISGAPATATVYAVCSP